LSSVSQAKEVEKQVFDTVHLGAKILCGGKRNKAMYSPTVIEDVVPGMPCFDEEVFGPVASMIYAKNIEDAIGLCNQSKFGLGATIYTNNYDLAEKLIPKIEDGAVFVNSLVKSDPRLPFGGTKSSGYGRELSLHGIREFVNAKTIFFA
jgi:succinate-semialdehyde dehydrogenase/glutarate-semialdehyde dehydrogenase